MTVQIHDDIYWIDNCWVKNDGSHIHTSVYLIDGVDASILIDTGSRFHEQSIIDEVNAITGGLDAIVLTESDLHHTENTQTIRDAYDDVELYTSFTNEPIKPQTLGLGRARRYNVDGSMSIAGRELGFPVPPLIDRSHEVWIVDHATNTLFSGDGLGHYHQSGECRFTSKDFPGGIPYERIRQFHEDTLLWLKYVDPPKLRAAVDRFLEVWDVSNIAPIHGNPIGVQDLEEYIENVNRSFVEISDG